MVKVAETIKKPKIETKNYGSTFTNKMNDKLTYQPKDIKTTGTNKILKGLEDRKNYLIKNTASGAFRAGTAMVDAPLQEAQSDLRAGARKEGKNKYLQPLEMLASSFMPLPYSIAKTFNNSVKRQKEDSSLMDKALAGFSDAKQVVSGPTLPGVKELLKGYGTLDKDAYKKVANLSETINKPSENYQQKVLEEGEKYKNDPLNVTNTLGSAMQQVGFMGPSIATTAITSDPSAGLAAMGLSSKGASTREALQQGVDLDKAISIGDVKGGTEVLTENLTGGLNVFGKGALDDIALKTVDKKITKPLMNFLVKQGLGIGGEIGEEFISNIVGNTIDKYTTDPNRKIWDWDEALQTAKETALTTLLLNGLTGGYTPRAYNENINQMRENTGINQAVNQLNQSLPTDITQANSLRSNVMDEIRNSENLGDSLINNQMDKVSSLNDAEKSLLSDLTIKRKNGQLTQEDMNTISFLNQKANNNIQQTMEQRNPIQQTIKPTLQESAQQQGYKGNMENLPIIQDMLDKRGIDYKFDAEPFINNNEGALWNQLDNDRREVIFNPNISEEQMVEELAIHELTHDIMSSKTGANDLRTDKILNYVKTLPNYEEVRQELENIYSDRYDINNSEFNDFINEEIVAKTLGQRLGNQEFVNQITNSNPSLARRIYNWVLDKIDSLVNSKGKNIRNEELYWKNVKNNFEKAYNQEYLGIDSNNNKHLYEVNNIKKTSGISETSPNRPTGFSEESISQPNENVKYSISKKTGKLQDGNGNEVNIKTTQSANDKNLMVMQGLSVDNLKNVLSLGGLPVPSLGITNTKYSDVFDEFGGPDGAVLLFSKDTINPKIKGNEVYSRDVYSKTVPEIYQKVDKRTMNKVMDEFRPYESEYGTFNKHDYSKSSLDSIVNDLSYSSAAKAKFLDDNGYKFDKAYRGYKSSYGFTEEVIEKFLRENPDLASFNPMSADTTTEVENIAPRIKEKAIDMMAESNPKFSRKQIETLFKDKWYFNDVVQFYRDINGYRNLNGQKEFDIYTTRDNIDAAVEPHKQEFESWLRNKFKDVYGDKYFENDSGRAKEYTLENLTSYMKKGNTQAQQKGMFDTFGIGQAKGGAAQQFKTIEQIREASSKLVDADTYKERHKAFEDIDEDVRTDIGDTRISKGEDLFDVYSDYYMALSKAASGVDPETALKNNHFTNLSKEQIEKFTEISQALANLPAKYFEAKPQRAVGLDEIKGIAVPNTIDAELREQLLNNGFTLAEYDPKVEGDKQRVINQFDNLKFNKESPKFDEFIKENIPKEGTQKENLQDMDWDDYVEKKKTTGKEGQQYWEKQGADEKVAKILSEVPKQENKTTAADKYHELVRAFVDKGETIKRISKATNNPNLYYMYDRMGLSRNEAQSKIGKVQTDLNGKKFKNFKDIDGNDTYMSIQGILKDAKDNKIPVAKLNEYLAHNLNVDRYSQGKPVFGNSVNTEMSQETIKALEKQYPQIKRIASNVWQFNKNQLQTMVDSGLINQEFANELMKKNPHYIRIQRNVEKSNNKGPIIDKNGRVQINKRIDTAKGSNIDIMPIMETMAQYTDQVNSAMRKNLFAQELMNTLSMGTENADTNFITDEESFGINPDLIKENEDGTYTMTAFKNGVATEVPINKGIYDALVPNKVIQAMENSSTFKTVTYPGRKLSQIFRGLTTNQNPIFMATNFFKDIGDAPFNSKYTTTFYQNYINAMKDKATNGYYTQLYDALGGNQNSYFKDGNFTENSKSKAEKVVDTVLTPIEIGNEYIESLPRIAEFMSTIKANGYEVNAEGELIARKGVKPKKSVDATLNEALYNAAEITTNFKRGGDVSKMLNRNGATFLNASIQGFSKQIRNFTDIQSPKQAIHLLTKALIFGIAPTMLNDAMHGDDDEYKELQDYQKDNYYLFKGKDGKWIRIPKGRAMSVLGSAARRTKGFVEGDKNAYSGFTDFAKNQVAPNSIFENNILAPFSQVKNNESWSGSKIIPDSVERPTEEQYNEKTDAFSKWLGGVLKDVPVPKKYENFKTPMAINYLIDQYTGVVGDTILPMTAQKATSEDSPLVAPLTSKFTLDTAYSNKSVSNFYDTKKEIEKKKNSQKATPLDKAKNSYMTSKNMQISNLYKEQREIQSDPTLSKKEKYKEARKVQVKINNLAKDTVENVNNVEKNDYYVKIGDYYYKKVRKDGEDTYVKDSSKKIPTDSYALYDYYKNKYETSKRKEEKKK